MQKIQSPMMKTKNVHLAHMSLRSILVSWACHITSSNLMASSLVLQSKEETLVNGT